MKAIYYIFILSIIMAGTACSDMNSLHEQYLDRGEIIYTGVIDSLKSYPGNNRVKFTWELNSDPRITKTVLYWNDRQDSSVVEVNRTTGGRLPMETTLSVSEGSYIFQFATKDDYGHQSLYVEQTVMVYGEKLARTLTTRNVASLSRRSDMEVQINWAVIDVLTMQYTTIRYMDHSNPNSPVVQTIRVDNEQMQTILPGARSGEILEVITTHLPQNGLDLIDAITKEYELP